MSDKQISTGTQITPADVANLLDKLKDAPVDHVLTGAWGHQPNQPSLKHLYVRCPSCTLRINVSCPGVIGCPHCTRVMIRVLAP